MNINQSMQHTYPKLTLTLNDKSYSFSKFQLITFFIGSPILSVLIYFFFKLKVNYWIYELTTQQIVFILINLFKIDAYVISNPDHAIFPAVYIPNHPFNEFYAITINCIAGHVFSILIGVIVCIPRSRAFFSKKAFFWRKLKALISSVVAIYLLNLFRISLLLYLNYKGIPFVFIHESLFFLSAIIGALIFVIILKKWLPESFISIYYSYRLISKKEKKDCINHDCS